eukprot:s4526_g8.t1
MSEAESPSPIASRSASPAEGRKVVFNATVRSTSVPIEDKILFACRRGDLPRLRRLLVPQRGSEGPLTPELGGVCAHLAAGKGHTACCELLLRAGVSPDSRDRNGATLLARAALYGHTELTQRLLKQWRGNPLDVDHMGRNAVHVACLNDVRALALILYVQQSQTRIAQFLLFCKCGLDAVDKQGGTALTYAGQAGNREVVSLLLSRIFCQAAGFFGVQLLKTAVDHRSSCLGLDATMHPDRPQALKGESAQLLTLLEAMATISRQDLPAQTTRALPDVEELPGYEQADHLKGQGKDKFARGEVNEAITCWLQALDSIPPPSGTRGLLGILQGSKPAEVEEKEDGRVLKMRVALLLNLALAHMRLKKFRQAVGFCDEALFDEPGNTKALYRKADALGELCDWHEAEEAAVKLQESGEEGTKLATQKREEWKRRRRQADDKQKKMWSAALDKEKAVPEQLPEVKQSAQKAEIEEAWCTPKIQMMRPFDLRTKKIDWEEGEDFDDKIWKESLGRREATFYQKRALPMSLLAGVALADLDLPKQSELVVHCILDGNMAPFAEPHATGLSISVGSCSLCRLVLWSQRRAFLRVDLPLGFGALLASVSAALCFQRIVLQNFEGLFFGRIMAGAVLVCLFSLWGGVSATIQHAACPKDNGLGLLQKSPSLMKVQADHDIGIGEGEDFYPVDGGVDRACRGASPGDNKAEYFIVATGHDLESCKATCTSTNGCKGIEFHVSGRCELWTRPEGIAASISLTDYTCLWCDLD